MDAFTIGVSLYPAGLLVSIRNPRVRKFRAGGPLKELPALYINIEDWDNLILCLYGMIHFQAY